MAGLIGLVGRGGTGAVSTVLHARLGGRPALNARRACSDGNGGPQQVSAVASAQAVRGLLGHAPEFRGGGRRRAEP